MDWTGLTVIDHYHHFLGLGSLQPHTTYFVVRYIQHHLFFIFPITQLYENLEGLQNKLLLT